MNEKPVKENNVKSHFGSQLKQCQKSAPKVFSCIHDDAAWLYALKRKGSPLSPMAWSIVNLVPSLPGGSMFLNWTSNSRSSSHLNHTFV